MADPLILLRDLIEERTGLFFRNDKGLESLEARLNSRMENIGCGSLSEYYDLLVSQQSSTGEWLNVIAELVKPFSSFIRHERPMSLLTEKILPRFSAETKPLKIWSAACSTGEEPVSIAMALSEGGWFDGLEIEIYASDASFDAIEKARQGIYSDVRARHLADGLREKYFTKESEEWRFTPELNNKIRWRVANLMSENEIAELAASQIVFCRNVFIYFSDAAIVHTLNLFGKYMPGGSCLFTDEGAHFESLMLGTGIFEPQRTKDATVWMRLDRGAGG